VKARISDFLCSSMLVFSKISSRVVRIGGEQHSGWLPEGFAIPLPTPVREINMTFEITDDGAGNFLLIYCSDDKSLHGDTWHESIEDAKQAAEQYFGILENEWPDDS
jgi:hypothetical protein